jgi:hypothetical protein
MRVSRWTVVLAVWLTAANTRGEEPARVAVVHDGSADQRIPDRLRAELSALGLEVVDITLPTNEPATSLDSAARRVGAFAAVQVVTTQGGVEVWILDPATGKTLLRELVRGPSGTVDDVVALQAVELLRARLRELRFFPKAPGRAHPTRTVAPAAPPPQPDREASRLWVELGPGLSASPGGVGVTGQALVGLRWRLTRTFGLDAWGSLPVTRAVLRRPEGAANIAPWFFGADTAVWFLPPRANWQLTAAVGIAAVYLDIDGHPRPPWSGRADPLMTALPFVRLALERRFSVRLGVGLDAFVGFAAPHPSIRFSGREVANWGRPLVLSTLTGRIALD